MMRAAARDPLWAFVALLAAPFDLETAARRSVHSCYRAVRRRLRRPVLPRTNGLRPGSIPFIALDLVTLLVLAALAFRSSPIR
jgi:type IV secretion system protein VirD4